jgi:hypothetical protein
MFVDSTHADRSIQIYDKINAAVNILQNKLERLFALGFAYCLQVRLAAILMYDLDVGEANFVFS